MHILHFKITQREWKWGFISVLADAANVLFRIYQYMRLTTDQDIIWGVWCISSPGGVGGVGGVEEHLKLHSQPASSSFMHHQHHVPWPPAATPWAARPPQLPARHRGTPPATSVVSGTSPAQPSLDSPSPAAETPPFKKTTPSETTGSVF